MIVKWDTIKCDEPGCRRGRFTGLDGTNFNVNLITLPVSQRSPLHTFTGEHVIYLLEGRVDWVHKGRHHVLEPNDMLFIPHGIWYEYFNVGSTDALFLAVKGCVSDWPAIATFAKGETGSGDDKHDM